MAADQSGIGRRLRSRAIVVLKFPVTHWRGFLASLATLGVALFIPAWLLVDNYLNSAGAESLPNDAPLSAPRYNYFGNPVEVYSPGTSNDDLCVTFEFLGVDQATSQTNFGVLVGVTETGKQAIMTELGTLKHRPKTGTLLLSSKSGLSNFAIPFSVSSLEDAPPVSCGGGSGSIQMSQLDLYSGVRLTLNAA